MRWSKKERGAVVWNGYKVHLSETCDPDNGTPNLVTNVASSAATVPDQAMTTPIHQRLAERRLLPAEHLSAEPSGSAWVGAGRINGGACVARVLAAVNATGQSRERTAEMSRAVSIRLHRVKKKIPAQLGKNSTLAGHRQAKEEAVSERRRPSCDTTPNTH